MNNPSDTAAVMRPVMLSAGGTGGHLFPAEALAEEFLRRGRPVVVVTDRRGQAFRSLGEQTPVLTVRAATLKPGFGSKLKAVFDMGIGIIEAADLLRQHRPAIVVGFGGYPSVPAVFAAQSVGIRTILHEQNGILGKANAFLVKRAFGVATSLPDTRGIPQGIVTSLTGNPVREGVVQAGADPYVAPEGLVNILVTGGSQGATIFSSIVPEAAALLPEGLRSRLRIVQQCRDEGAEAARGVYEKAGISAEIAPFFTDMADRLRSCHLFIGRSGASTVAEIAAVGRPAIFIPFMHADRQQVLNAESLSRNGAAWIIEQPDFTPEIFAQKLRELLENPAILAQSAKAAKACARPDAAARLADFVESRIPK